MALGWILMKGIEQMKPLKQQHNFNSKPSKFFAQNALSFYLVPWTQVSLTLFMSQNVIFVIFGLQNMQRNYYT